MTGGRYIFKLAYLGKGWFAGQRLVFPVFGIYRVIYCNGLVNLVFKFAQRKPPVLMPGAFGF
jgi:hypothetical protein